MFITPNIDAQNSFGLAGYRAPNRQGSSFGNSFELNPSNFSLLKDWGISFSYGGEFADDVSSNLYLISLSKRIGAHNLSARYSPGYQKEFLFTSNESIVGEDTSLQSLNSSFTYKELLGLGYSLKFSDELSAGFTLRYFNQEFNREVLNVNFPGDTLYITSENEIEKINFWKTDIGINYSPFKNLFFSLSSINLLNFGELSASAENEPFEIRRDKGAMIGVNYSPFKNFDINLLFETNNSFQTGFDNYFEIFNGSLGIGLTAFHDKYQSPFIAGIIPALTYSTKLFGITLSGIKYFSDRGSAHSFTEFKEEGITNIINNKYSFDKAVLTFTFILNTIPERLVKLLEVDIVKDIYPTFTESYIDSPFAVGKAINLTDKPVTVKPACRIEGLNVDLIQSPNVTIAAGDTGLIKYYTIIPESYTKEKAEISYANFYLTTINEEPDDQSQKAVLVNGKNSWDGKINNLRYFIKYDSDFSMTYSKNILSQYKENFDTLQSLFFPFYKAKFIFENFIKRLVYISDPRASEEYVQFPNETLKLKGGDCDDLSVSYSSFLESVGIQTALVDYKLDDGIRHVNVMLNTELNPDQAKLITQNENKYFVRKNVTGIDQVWIPIEVTSLTDFETAWNLGAEKFFNEAVNNYELAKGKVEIVDIY